MPKKKKEIDKVETEEEITASQIEEEKALETDEELTENIKEKIFAPEPKLELPEEETAKPSDTVKVRVLIGTLKWEGGTFEKGQVFECSRERADSFGYSVQILKY